MRGGSISSGALIASPTFAASVGLLLLNDHVLKAAWPGFVTGKLSDVAGVAMVAIGLTALVRHRAAAFAFTAVAFTLLKTVPTAAVWTEPALGGVTRTDPTDVGALLILVPLWPWVASRSASDPVDVRWWIVPAQVVAIVGAVFATTATSCATAGTLDVQAVDGTLFARADTEVWSSADGGRTWTETELESWDSRFGEAPSEACVDGRCFQLVWSQDGYDSVQVVELIDGERIGILGFSVEQRQMFRDAVRPACEDLSASSIAGASVDGDVHVVLHMGEAGVLHRGPSERWEWVPVGPWGLRTSEVPESTFLEHPIADRPDTPLLGSRRLARSLLFAAIAAPFVAAWPLAQLATHRRRRAAPAVALAVGLGVLMLPAVLFVAAFGEGAPEAASDGYGTGALVLAVAAAVGVALLAAWFGRRRRERPPAPLPPPRAEHRVG